MITMCELHQSKSKPVVCGLFPLGRIFNYDKNDVTYFTQENICGNNNETHTVRDWLNDFGIDELEDCSAIWQEIIAFAGAVTSTVKNEQHQETLANVLAFFMYLKFNTAEAYVPQAQRNFEKIKEILGVWKRVKSKGKFSVTKKVGVDKYA